MQAPGLRQITPQASLLLLGAAGAWVGVVVVARHMGPMPGTMGLGIGTFTAVWVLMMTAMMLPSVTPFVSLYTRSFGESRAIRMTGFAVRRSGSCSNSGHIEDRRGIYELAFTTERSVSLAAGD
jgi:predicted metal-binding membrane protein